MIWIQLILLGLVQLDPIGWTRHFFSRGDANAVGLQVAFWSAIGQTWKGRLAWDNAEDPIWELESPIFTQKSLEL